MIVQRRVLEAQLLEWICMGKELPYEVTISRDKPTAQVVCPDIGGISKLIRNSKRGGGNKTRQSFHLHFELSIWLLFPGIKLPWKKMKVLPVGRKPEKEQVQSN